MSIRRVVVIVVLVACILLRLPSPPAQGVDNRRRYHRIVVTSLYCTPLRDQSVVAFYNCTLLPVGNNIKTNLMTANVMPAVDINMLIMNVKLLLQLGRVNRTYLAMTLNGCTEMSRINSIPILRFIMIEVHRVSNFPFQCPLKKGINYYLRNYSNDWNLPPYVPQVDWTFIVDYWMEGKNVFQTTMKGKVVVQSNNDI